MSKKSLVGRKFGCWTVSQHQPVAFDDLGSANGGMIKLVNQATFAVVIVQHDHALRCAKWWASFEGRHIEDGSPKKVIDVICSMSPVAA